MTETHSPVVIELINESTQLTVGDTITLKINKEDENLAQTIINIPDTFSVEKDKLVLSNGVTTDFNKEKNELTIDWVENEQADDITLKLKAEKVGSSDIFADTLVDAEAVKSNTLTLSITDNESAKSETSSESVSSSSESEDQISDTSSSSEQISEAFDESESEPESSRRESSSSKSSESEEVNSQSESAKPEAVQSRQRAASNPSEESEISTLSEGEGDTAHVTTWEGFVEALKSTNISTITVEDTLEDNTPDTSSLKDTSPDDADVIDVGRDKEIIGIESPYPTVHLEGNQINIGSHTVKVSGLTLWANQNDDEIDDPSMFYSDSPDAELYLDNVSYPYMADGPVGNQTVTDITEQNGQVALLKNGHVYISGNSYFKNHTDKEVFEANHITFLEGTNSIAYTEVDDQNKEVINLYGDNPTITIEKDANVSLGTDSDESSIIDLPDEVSPVEIHIGEGATLNIRADNSGTIEEGAPLIDLSNAPDSTISLAQGATLDIQNHRDGAGDTSRNLGGLFNLDGTVSMAGTDSQVEIWDETSESFDPEPTNTFYTNFPSVINGQLNLVGPVITSASAKNNIRSESSNNPNNSNQLFTDFFNHRDTNDIKRLKISGPVKTVAPIIDDITDQSTEISGHVVDGVDTVDTTDQIVIKDQNGVPLSEAEIEEDGIFTVDLSDQELTAGDTLTAIIIDENGIGKSAAAPIIVGGSLSLTTVPNLDFGTIPIPSTTQRIRPAGNENTIAVTDTREDKSPWSLTAKATPLTPTVDGKQYSLNEDALVFVDGEKTDPLNDCATIIEGEGSTESSITWEDDEGIMLEIDPTRSTLLSDSYSTTITWTLNSTPPPTN